MNGAQPAWGASDEAGKEGREPSPGGGKCDSSAQLSHLGQGYQFGNHLQRDGNKLKSNDSIKAERKREKSSTPHSTALCSFKAWWENPRFYTSQKRPPLAIMTRVLFTYTSTSQLSQAHKLFSS